MECLYHYCSNEKCFNILNGKTIRLSDIKKSNDYQELRLFFPRLIYVIEDMYKNAPFNFKYNGLYNEEAFLQMTKESYIFWKNRFYNGDFSNLVICFSEAVDSLSQWRGYADNGKGCCIGFSKQLLQEYCEKYKNILRMEKVEYLSDKEIQDRIHDAAKVCIKTMKTMRSWIIDNLTRDDNNPDTDGLLHYNFDGLIGNVFNDTLRFKSCAFREENEWRIFFKIQFRKAPSCYAQKIQTILKDPMDLLIHLVI